MTLKKLGIYTASALILGAVASFALPRHVSVERTAVLDADAPTILALAASNEGFQSFNPYRTLDPNLTVDMFGPISGVGSGFYFDSKDGTGSQTVSEVTAAKIVYTIDMGPLGQPIQSITTQPTDTGTAVTWRVDSDLGFNPVFRVFGLFMDGMMGPTFEIGLENLAKAAA